MNPSNSSPRPSSTNPSRKNLWPLGIICGLAFVVITNLTMVTIAIQNPSLPETESHWNDALAFNEEYDLRKQSAEKNWTFQIKNCSSLDEQDQCALRIRILDAQGQPVTGLRGQVRLRRGDHNDSDRDIALDPLGSGDYRARFPLGRRGMYSVELRTQGRTGSWRATRRLLIEPLPFIGRHS